MSDQDYEIAEKEQVKLLDIIVTQEVRIAELEQRLAVEEAHSEKYMAENKALRDFLKKLHESGQWFYSALEFNWNNRDFPGGDVLEEELFSFLQEQGE